MNETHELTGPTASLVPEAKRMAFLPNCFGRYFLMGEVLVYGWLDRLSADYSGGCWEFYTLSNGGFYLAPKIGQRLRMAVEGNGFEGELSPDAAGIVATLFALNQLAFETRDDHLIDCYHALRDFALEHAEAALIAQAID